MPLLRCLSALKWIKCPIAIFGTAAIHANLLRLGTFRRKYLIYDSAAQEEGPARR